MDKAKSSLKTLSFSQIAAIAWLVIFTAAAFYSHIYLSLGKQVEVVPEQAYVPPFRSIEQLFGTDQLGRNVFLYLLLSCRTAWLLAFPPLIVATLIGVAAGTGAAILGNSGLKIPVAKLWLIALVSLSYSYIYNLVHHWPPLSTLPIVPWVYYGSGVFLLIFILIRKNSNTKKNRTLTIAVDDVLHKIIDVWSTLPKLLLLLILTAFTPFSIITLMGWIAATYWVLPARLARASVLQIKKGVYYETTHALGIPFNRVFTHYLLPQLKGPVLTNFCFAASGLLGVGSTLAYLGIGIPADVPSWGKMLANARFSVEAWWLLFFPAVFLLSSIFSLQVIGHRLSTNTKSASVTK